MRRRVFDTTFEMAVAFDLKENFLTFTTRIWPPKKMLKLHLLHGKPQSPKILYMINFGNWQKQYITSMNKYSIIGIAPSQFQMALRNVQTV